MDFPGSSQTAVHLVIHTWNSNNKSDFSILFILMSTLQNDRKDVFVYKLSIRVNCTWIGFNLVTK